MELPNVNTDELEAGGAASCQMILEFRGFGFGFRGSADQGFFCQMYSACWVLACHTLILFLFGRAGGAGGPVP